VKYAHYTLRPKNTIAKKSEGNEKASPITSRSIYISYFKQFIVEMKTLKDLFVYMW